MDSKRFLIIGANGQLGKALQAKYPDAIAVDRESFDMTDQQAVANYDWSKVDVILNAAAYTNVDGAETTEGRVDAWRINAQGPAYLTQAAIQHGLTLVHVSSDYVFDGSHSVHIETESLSPISDYGASKAAGDIAVAGAIQHYILRTTWLIGDGANFVRTMIGLAAKNISPTVVDDQIGRLTFTSTLVDAIDQLVTTKADYGTYNVTGDGESASWADITRAIFTELGREDLHVTGTSTEKYFADKIAAGDSIAATPLQSTLDLSKLQSAGLKPNDWRVDLQSYVADITKSEETET